MDNLKKQELHSIFQEIQKGNTDKIKELYEKYNRIVYGIVFSIIKNKEDSEDIVQMVFMKLFQIENSKLPKDNEASWLYSFTKNETLNYLRKKKEEVDIDEAYYITEDDKELSKIINNDSYNRIIAKLDKQAQEIVSLKILSNMSFKEISLLLNMPMGTVQWKYYSSLYTLRLLLGNISMVIIGILLLIKSNITKRQTEKSNSTNDADMVSDIESGKVEEPENETSSSVENESSHTTDSIIQNEIVEVNVPQENTYLNIGILSITGIFLIFSIIFTIILAKHQQKVHKNVSK